MALLALEMLGLPIVLFLPGLLFALWLDHNTTEEEQQLIDREVAVWTTAYEEIEKTTRST